jgi:hypothetical protein
VSETCQMGSVIEVPSACRGCGSHGLRWHLLRRLRPEGLCGKPATRHVELGEDPDDRGNVLVRIPVRDECADIVSAAGGL